LTLKKEFDDDGFKDDITIRKLYWILKMPVINNNISFDKKFERIIPSMI